jgi:hypothetical protein
MVESYGYKSCVFISVQSFYINTFAKEKEGGGGYPDLLKYPSWGEILGMGSYRNKSESKKNSKGKIFWPRSDF